MVTNTILNAFTLICIGLFVFTFVPCIWKIFFGKLNIRLALNILGLQFLFFLLPVLYKDRVSHTVSLVYYIVGICLLVYTGFLLVWKISILYDPTPQKASLRILEVFLILGVVFLALYFVTTPLGLFLITMFSIMGLISVLARPFCSFLGNAFSHFILSFPDEHDDEIPFLSSRAEGLRKQEKSEEAIAEIDSQLQRIPGNIDAILLKATILAEDLGKVDEATNLINEMLASPKAKKLEASNYSLLKNKISDWQLKYNRNVIKAQLALEKIILKHPNSSYAFLAKQRISKLCLPEEKKELESIKLGNYEEDIGLSTFRPSIDKGNFFISPKPKKENNDASKAEFLSLETYLEENPEDCEARERMASIYAREIGDLETALYHLDYLINLQQNAPRDKIVRWYNLKADYYLLFDKLGEARESLEKIIEQYPDKPVAVIAGRRINQLKRELQKKIIYHKLPKNKTVPILKTENRIALPARNNPKFKKIPVRLVTSRHPKTSTPESKEKTPPKIKID